MKEPNVICDLREGIVTFGRISIIAAVFILMGSLAFHIAAGGNREFELSVISFSQLDWYGPQGTLALANSSWGKFSFSYIPDTSESYYVNLSMAAKDNTPQWVVGNLPLFPSLCGNIHYEAVYFDLTELGFYDGEPVEQVKYVLSVTSYPLSDMPSGETEATAMESEIYYAWIRPYWGKHH